MQNQEQINIGNVDKVNVKASAGGIIDVSGKATNSDVAITSGGILKAADLYESD
jgi:hypothetical protein